MSHASALQVVLIHNNLTEYTEKNRMMMDLAFSLPKWLVGDFPFYVKIWRITDPPAFKTPIFDLISLVAPQP